MRHIALAAGLAGSFFIAAATPTLAFGAGCGGRAVECYDKVRLPDVYATETRSVLLRPAYRSVVPTPPLIRNYAVPVLMRPGRWRTVVAPPVYGMRRERVVVAPAQRVDDEVSVATRGVSSARHVAHVRPAVYGVVERPVLLRPAEARRIYEPPVHGYINRSVVVRPAGLVVFSHPPVVGVTREHVLIRPGGYAWVRSRSGAADHW